GAINMHLPERWGYLQFSTAAPGSIAVRPDPTGPARHLLHRIYYAQRAYRDRHGQWARSLHQLGLDGLTDSTLLAPPALETAGSLWEARTAVRGRNGRPQRVRIRGDARIWTEGSR